MEHNQYQGAQPPEAPPSYDQSMAAGGPGGFQPPPGAAMYPPPPGPMYPPLPSDKSAAPNVVAPPAPVVVTQVQYVTAPNFGHRPVNMVCPYCQQNITTATDSEPSAMAYVVSAVLCVFGFWVCACIPCCIDSLQQVTHKCPACKKTLGRYSGSGM